MKKRKIEKIFLETLAKTSNISIACEQVGLSRQSIYRWMKEDYKFQCKVDEALFIGKESINDLAESKLVVNVKNGHQRSIEYWLNHNKKGYKSETKYGRYNPKEKETLTAIKYTLVTTPEEIQKLDELKKVRDEIKELSRNDTYDN